MFFLVYAFCFFVRNPGRQYFLCPCVCVHEDVCIGQACAVLPIRIYPHLQSKADIFFSKQEAGKAIHFYFYVLFFLNIF